MNNLDGETQLHMITIGNAREKQVQRQRGTSESSRTFQRDCRPNYRGANCAHWVEEHVNGNYYNGDLDSSEIGFVSSIGGLWNLMIGHYVRF